MFSTLDYIIIGILVISAILGFRKGFIATLGGIISTIAALVLAFMYQDELELYLESNFHLQSILTELLQKKLPFPTMGGEISSLPLLDSSLSFMENPHGDIAHLLLMAVSFLIIFILGGLVLKLIFNLLNGLFNWGVLGWINRMLGLLFVLLKNILIMAILLGLICPLMERGIQVGVIALTSPLAFTRESILAASLLDLFKFVQLMLGIGV